MKVVWLSHFYPFPPAGGALQRSYHLLRQVARRHRVHLVSLSKARNRPSAEQVSADYPAPREFCDAVDVFPIPSESSWLGRLWVLASGLWGDDPYDDRWLASRELHRFLSIVIDVDAVDLVHLDTIGLAQYSAHFQGVPLVMNHHNIESHMMARRAAQESGPLRSAYMGREAEKLGAWERRWCGQCTENLVVSALDGRRLHENVPDVRWTVVPNGVDTDYFRPGNIATPDRDGLVFVGRMSWYPNRDAVEWLLDEIWPALVESDSGRSLTLVGSRPDAIAERVADASGVDAPGFVPDVRPYMNRAAIYVCPIRTGGGTRLKILDAMAMGIPLVATGMSVEGLDLEDGRHYLRAESPSDFVQAVSRLEQNLRLRDELARASRREAVRRFSWSRIGDQLDQAYRQAVGAEPRR